ncbi:MAG: hypothetical protein KDA66_06380 [Planctomycetaceae bacterium]|nr:hypothetical protein [Planctomycetaceae bacterium]
MTGPQQRRMGWILVGLLVATALGITNHILTASHVRTPYYFGWLLLVMVVFLAAFGVRKKLTFLPPTLIFGGNAANWLRFHIFIGLLSAVVFGHHTGLRLPTGFVETTLAALFLGTFLSGVTGLILSRVIPARLTSRGEEVLFERIPMFRSRLRTEVEELVAAAAEKSGDSALVEFYETHLKEFFSGPKHILEHLIANKRPRRRLLQHAQNCRRFLNEPEHAQLDRITQLIQMKDDLDFHLALQGALKMWLFVHLPLTCGLLIVAVFHLLLVHAFT